MKIAMIGAGAFGRALGQVLTENGYGVAYYDKTMKTPLSVVLEGAEMMVLAVPSNTVSEILALLPYSLPLIVTTKGILDASIFDGFEKISVISGPGFADDIARRKMTYLTTPDKTVAQFFETEYMQIEYSDDVRGVLMCGALKNAYAIGAGMRGLLSGSDEWEIYIKEAALEMAEILSRNKARPETVNCYCGIGDLKLTCGTGSRNYEFGLRVRENPDYHTEKTVEGISTLKHIASGEIIVPEHLKIINELAEDSLKWV